MPTTPPATRGPGLPVDSESSWPPLPKSSSPPKTTIDRPMIEWGPMSFTCLSSMCTLQEPSSATSKLPRSPAIRSSSFGPPWFLAKGLKMPPALVRPWLKSPKMWTWMPWSPGARPLIEPSMTVGLCRN